MDSRTGPCTHQAACPAFPFTPLPVSNGEGVPFLSEFVWPIQDARARTRPQPFPFVRSARAMASASAS